MDALFPTPPQLLPQWLLHLNLLRAFIWYISAYFVISLLLRLRFYKSVYEVSVYVRLSCPRIYGLVHEHWFVCMKDGLFNLIVIYGGILLAYMTLNQLVWPLATINVNRLASLDPGLLVLMLAVTGTMLAVDLVLMAQIGLIDTSRVIKDLQWSEEWLGGNLNRFLNLLGKWNPIKRYADSVTLESIQWLNVIFRSSLAVMIFQLILRLLVAASLFVCYLLGR
ncbi:MAG: hypothetical protein U1D30_13035 [Planctomycetota bacterium]